MKRVMIIFCAITSLLAINRCSGRFIVSKVVVPSQSSVTEDVSYQDIKSKWTVVLRSTRRGRGGIMPGRGSAASQAFPMTVTATLMDDLIIESGLRYYEDTISMSPAETDSFRQNYSDLHEPDKFIIIEASLKTSLAENYLDMSRWTIFLEDDERNQSIPTKIADNSVSTRRFEGLMDEPRLKRSMYVDFSQHKRNIILYFPKNDYYGKPIIHENLKYLKLVFMTEVGGRARAEGTWYFSEIE